MRINLTKFTIVFVIIISCATRESTRQIATPNVAIDQIESDTIRIVKTKTVTLEYDNYDNKKFGVEFFEGDLPIGQPSIALDDDFVYIVDAFHNNVKKFVISDESLSSSKALSENRIWLNDILEFNSQIVVTSELDSIYLFDKDLNLLSRKYLKKGRSSFVRKYDNDSLLLFFRDSKEYVTLNRSLQIINSREVDYAERGDEVFYKNKKIEDITDGVYRTQYGIFKMTLNPYFDNIDFNERILVSLAQDLSNVILSIHIME
ncbi:MAG: hypothetical protein ABJG78_12570 [Cyclobacteriaceae bacterium]